MINERNEFISALGKWFEKNDFDFDFNKPFVFSVVDINAKDK